MEQWQLYLLRCADGSLYTGITKNLEKRLQQHNQGRASKYTRTRLPVKLVYQESCVGHGSALTRESEIKGYSKLRKEELVNS